MSICYHPHAFDAQRFGAQSDTCSTDLDLVTELTDCTVRDSEFERSIDGALESEIFSARVHPDRGSVSLVENVRSALDPTSPVAGHAEAFGLLGYASEFDGRRQAADLYVVGYLMPEEIRRVSTLLAEVPYPGSPGQDEDRLLLLRLFTMALKGDHGLYWMWL